MVSSSAGTESWIFGTTPSVELSKGVMPTHASRCGNAACLDVSVSSSQSLQSSASAPVCTLRCYGWPIRQFRSVDCPFVVQKIVRENNFLGWL